MPDRRLAIGILLLAVISAWASLRTGQPPAPLERDAPATAFSAGRALDVLQRILADERPHPLGSDENHAVRDRVVAEFDRIGLQAEVRSRFVCGASSCATVENILARLPAAEGAPMQPGILVTAHYDSVAAGPGAGDDGAGVAAIIEVARALTSGPALQRDVWFLADDGEEAGLLGAYAFVQSPEFARIGWVVNLEARGDTGASSLIETQSGNAGVVAALGALPRPSGTSLDYEIYKTLPNDTDFTVYRQHGAGGANFALSRGAARYHTPLDDIGHLSPGSLQHHGDNALAMVRAFAAAPDDALRSGHDAAFVHPVSAFQVAWPVTWNPFLLAIGALGWLMLAWRTRRACTLRWAALALASVVVTVGWALVLVPAWLLALALGALGATPAAWTAQGLVLSSAFVALGIAWAWALAGWMQRRWGDAALALAGLVPFLLLATAAVAWMPGAAIIPLLPILTGVLAGQLAPRRVLAWAGLAGLVATALVYPYAIGGHDAIGRDGLVTTPLLATLMVLPLLPMVAAFGRHARVPAGLALAACLGAATVAWLQTAFDEDTPRALNLAYIAADGQPGHVAVHVAADTPPGWLEAQGFASEAVAIDPWPETEYRLGPAGPALPAPSVEILDDMLAGETRRVTMRVRPASGGDTLLVRLPRGVEKASVRVQGEALAPSRWPWESTVAYLAAPLDGVTFAFEVPAVQASRIVVIGQSRGLPERFGDIVDARDAVATPIHGGDRTQAWRAVELP